MKKILLLCTVATSMLFTTSCLDSNDNSVSGTNQFAVVQTNATSGTKYINVPLAGMVQGTALNTYEAGDALILSSYKVNTSSANSQGILNSEYINIETSYPNRIQKQVLFQTADTVTNISNQIGIKSLSLTSNAIESAFFNRVLVTYTTSLADGEASNLAFYYDAKKQVDRQGNALASDRAVLDIIVTIVGEGLGEKQDKVDRMVLNTTELRERLTPTSYPNNAAVAKVVDLRFSKYNATTQKYTLDYVSSQLGFNYYPSSSN